MDRREFLHAGAALAAVAGMASAGAARAAPAPAAAGEFALDAYSRNLQWLRSAKDLAKGVSEMGLKTVDLTVGAPPAHVNVVNVKTELPAFTRALKDNGITVTAITCAITDATSPNADAILAAAAASGIKYYSWSGFTYDQAKPYRPQLDALKPRVAAIARLSQKYGMKALYQPKVGPENVGSTFFDILDVLRNFDPRYVALRYDTAALLQARPEAMATQLRLGAPYIGGIALNDGVMHLDLPVWNEGPFVGQPQELIGASGGGDNVGRDGGNPLAIGGGGRPLPYHFRPTRVGLGMLDLTLLGKTLKELNFDGPAECQIDYPLGGAETGATSISLQRQRVIGGLKRDRLIVEQGFADSWNIDIARPPFQQRTPAAAPRGDAPPAGF